MKKFIIATTLALGASLACAADATLSDAQIDAAFAKADANKDGTVSLAEAQKFGITAKAFTKANPDKDEIGRAHV